MEGLRQILNRVAFPLFLFASGFFAGILVGERVGWEGYLEWAFLGQLLAGTSPELWLAVSLALAVISGLMSRR